MKLNILSLLVSLITIAGASLPQRCFADLAGDFVHRHKQNQVDDIVEQAHGGRQAVLGALNAQLVNISGDDLRHRSVAVCLHEQYLFKGKVHDAAHGHDQHDDDGGHNGRQIDVDDTLQPCSAVDGGRLVQVRRNARQRGDVDDRSKHTNR